MVVDARRGRARHRSRFRSCRSKKTRAWPVSRHRPTAWPTAALTSPTVTFGPSSSNVAARVQMIFFERATLAARRAARRAAFRQHWPSLRRQWNIDPGASTATSCVSAGGVDDEKEGWTGSVGSGGPTPKAVMRSARTRLHPRGHAFCSTRKSCNAATVLLARYAVSTTLPCRPCACSMICSINTAFFASALQCKSHLVTSASSL